jgi:hypothetical protein
VNVGLSYLKRQEMQSLSQFNFDSHFDVWMAGKWKIGSRFLHSSPCPEKERQIRWVSQLFAYESYSMFLQVWSSQKPLNSATLPRRRVRCVFFLAKSFRIAIKQNLKTLLCLERKLKKEKERKWVWNVDSIPVPDQHAFECSNVPDMSTFQGGTGDVLFRDIFGTSRMSVLIGKMSRIWQ